MRHENCMGLRGKWKMLPDFVSALSLFRHHSLSLARLAEISWPHVAVVLLLLLSLSLLQLCRFGGCCSCCCCCCEGLACFLGLAVGPWAMARSVVVACCRWPGLLSSAQLCQKLLLLQPLPIVPRQWLLLLSPLLLLLLLLHLQPATPIQTSHPLTPQP